LGVFLNLARFKIQYYKGFLDIKNLEDDGYLPKGKTVGGLKSCLLINSCFYAN